MRIHQLPPAIANQIAAGEVIERPASVVKELLENSLDAGADTISLEIGYGGLNQVKISDNGQGIVAEDLPLALAAHATSKISKLDDLYAIDSMGFRGEALASIASVAKITISSRPVDQEHAMTLQAKGSDIKVFPCARGPGTTVDVCDIFYNAPVRKRFLKSEKLEFQAIEAVVKRFALSAPQITITLKHNDKLVLSLPAALTERARVMRMSKIFGNGFVKEAIFINVERGGMHLFGWVSGPGFQRSQNDRQWVYLNQRMVKDKLLNHALKQAYEGKLHPGRFPSCLLYLSMDSNQVDVNVHPTKHEVRFQQPRLVHDFITSALSQALSKEEQQEVVPLQVYEIREPQPQLQLAPFKSQQLAEPWIILNNNYVLMKLQQLPHLVDIKKLYSDFLHEDLKQARLPLSSRPLLVPVRCFMGSNLVGRLGVLQQALIQVGLQIEEEASESINSQQILIRTVPIQLPYLDINSLLDLLSEQEHFDWGTLLESICGAQLFDPRLFTLEEQTQLQQFLLNHPSSNSVSKALTEDTCRMLLHV